ncbi:MAG: hypothetical protein J6Q89_01265 [Clostridia bacterium]|nr:hypothetical protein [Clostridia bacterium]
MNFDREQLDKLLSMDNDNFVALARTIAEAAGANKMKTEVLLANPDVLKRRISQMTPQEAREMVDSAGKEKGEEIMRMLRERGVDLGQ